MVVNHSVAMDDNYGKKKKEASLKLEKVILY